MSFDKISCTHHNGRFVECEKIPQRDGNSLFVCPECGCAWDIQGWIQGGNQKCEAGMKEWRNNY